MFKVLIYCSFCKRNEIKLVPYDPAMKGTFHIGCSLCKRALPINEPPIGVIHCNANEILRDLDQHVFVAAERLY